MAPRTLTIDDPFNGGSDPGAWDTAIAHSPLLRAQIEQSESCADGSAPPALAHAGGAALRSPQATPVASPGAIR